MTKRVLALLITITAFTAFAQPPRRAIRQRQAREQQRIGQGVRSGELTQEEAAKLEQEQREIARAKRAARSDGVVTQDEKQKINQMQNEASKNIREEKHDAEKVPAAQ
jgi:hypothetical protein